MESYGNARGRGRGGGRNAYGRGGGGRNTDGGRSRGGGVDGRRGRGYDDRVQYNQNRSQPAQPQPQQQPARVSEWPSLGRGAWGTRGGSHAGSSSLTGGGRSGHPSPAGVTPRPSPPPPPPSEFVNVPDIQSLSLSQKSPVAVQESRDRLVPIRRPDYGGKSFKRETSILVNHFRVAYNCTTLIRHYDVAIRPERSPEQGRPIRIKKFEFRMIRERLSSSEPNLFPLAKTAYDGEKNLYSMVELPTGEFKVTFSEAEDREGKTYVVAVKLVNQFELSKLTDYLSGSLLTIPREVFQGLDVVMKELPARHLILSGGCFFPTGYKAADSLGNAIIAPAGFQHSLKPTSQGLDLCVDYSVMPFLKPVGVIEFLGEYVRNFKTSNFKSLKRDVERALIGLKVQVTHRKTSQRFTIKGLTDKDTRDLSFCYKDPTGASPDRDVSLVNYFKEIYGWKVEHLGVPCLELGRKDKPNHVPMECCKIAPGQRLPREGLGKDAARMLKDKSIVPPSIRMQKIYEALDLENGPCGGDVTENFGINVDKSMTRVKGRVIGPPELKIGSSQGNPSKVHVDQERCQWNLGGKCVLKGKSIDRWAVIDFTASEKYDFLNANKFIPSLINRCLNLGIRMDNWPVYQSAGMGVLSNAHNLRNLFEDVIKDTEKDKKGKPQFILCVMAKKHDGYKLLKWISETETGTITQCCLSVPANKGNDQYFANLAMKINAKLGGSNMELLNHLPRFEKEKHVMLIGADVNHPSQGDKTVPSIAAVVATMNWPGANQYAARVQAQAHRCESILNFAEMCFDLVQSYERINGRRPDRIVIFRDGVSEGQFDMVLNEELAGLRMLFKMQGYFPTLTLIVARKRHPTRLFLEDMREGGRSGNTSPGTVVDTIIVHPLEFDFYLCSHHGAIGTSKSTHYHVLFDDHKFSSDDMQKFIYFLCFTFARCTKPVSLVTPVYYADLAAYRGRIYYEASQSVGSPRSMASSPSVASLAKLHTNLENSMFFI